MRVRHVRPVQLLLKIELDAGIFFLVMLFPSMSVYLSV